MGLQLSDEGGWGPIRDGAPRDKVQMSVKELYSDGEHERYALRDAADIEALTASKEKDRFKTTEFSTATIKSTTVNRDSP